MKIFFMIGWFILLIVCIIVLVLLANSESSPSSLPPIDPPSFISDTITENDMAKTIKKSQLKKTVSDRVRNPLNWFVVARAQGQISEAEKLIAAELNKYRLDWYREIAFEGLKFSDYGYARYDFLLITPKGIHLIEYDGKSSHSTYEQKLKDTLKDKFCERNSIPLTRYNSTHYYHLSYEILILMNQYGITSK